MCIQNGHPTMFMHLAQLGVIGPSLDREENMATFAAHNPQFGGGATMNTPSKATAPTGAIGMAQTMYPAVKPNTQSAPEVLARNQATGK